MTGSDRVWERRGGRKQWDELLILRCLITQAACSSVLRKLLESVDLALPESLQSTLQRRHHHQSLSFIFASMMGYQGWLFKPWEQAWPPCRSSFCLPFL